MKKLILFIAFNFSLVNAFAQWTSCASTSGTLSGTISTITINQLTNTPSLIIQPAPSSAIPNTGYLIVLHDSIAYDSLGAAIIAKSATGVLTPLSIGATLNDTISIVPFSYSLAQIKKLTHAMLYNTVPFLGSCCSIISSQTNTQFCASLNAIGINDSSDVNTLTDVINVISVYKYDTIRTMSVSGLKNALVNINTNIGTLNSIGCTNGVNQVCYAFDSLATNHDQYIVVQPCVSTNSTVNISACGTYTSPSGNYVWTSSNTYTDTIANINGCDSIITINLTINNNTNSTVNISACGTYTSPSGNYVWTSSNTYTDTIANVNGCDSIITINLTVNTINSLVNQLNDTLIANEMGASYQWLNCTTMALLTGDTNQSYNATVNGNYAVIITKNGCVDTSTCYSVMVTGVISNNFGANLVVYPNPTNGNFAIDLGIKHQHVMVSIVSSEGKLIMNNEYKNNQLLNIKLDQPAGIYFVTIKSGKKAAMIRMVKE